MAKDKTIKRGDALNTLLSKRIELLEKEIEVAKESKIEHTNLLKEQKRLAESQKSLNDFIDKGVDFVQKYTSAVGAMVLAQKAITLAQDTSRKSTEQWLKAAQPLDKLSNTYGEIGKRAKAYQKIVKQDIVIAAIYGSTVEEVNRVSEAWLDTMRFTDIGAHTEQIEKLTKTTLIYSKLLGKDAAAVQKQAEFRMFQYGESAEVAMHSLLKLRTATESVNAEFKDSGAAALWADDFESAVSEVIQGTDGFVQDIDRVNATMALTAASAFKMGQSYNQALESAKAMGKLFVGGGEGALQIRSGMMIIENLRSQRDETGKLKKEYLDMFTDTEKASIERLNRMDLEGKNMKDLALLARDSLGTTEAGQRAILETLEQIGLFRGSDLLPLMQSELGMSREMAASITDLATEFKTVDGLMAAINEKQADSQKRAEDLVKEEGALIKLMRSAGGRVVGIETIDRTIQGMDTLIGKTKAFATDVTVLMAGALGAGAIAVTQFIRRMGGVGAITQTVTASWGATVTLIRQAHAAAISYANTLRAAQGLPLLTVPGRSGPGMVISGGKGGKRSKAPKMVISGGKGDPKAPKVKPPKAAFGKRFGGMGAGMGGVLGSVVASMLMSEALAGSGGGGEGGGFMSSGLGQILSFTAMTAAMQKAPAMLGKAGSAGMSGLRGISAGAQGLSGMFSGTSLPAGLGGAAAGLGGAAALAGGAFAAPTMMLSSGIESNRRTDNMLRFMAEQNRKPVGENLLSPESYRSSVQDLAENPSWLESLRREGVIQKSMYSDVQALVQQSNQQPKAVSGGMQPSLSPKKVQGVGRYTRLGENAVLEITIPNAGDQHATMSQRMKQQ